MRPAAHLLLLFLVSLGAWNVGSFAFEHFQTGEACPEIADVIPACYVAFAGYARMAIGDVCPRSESGTPLCYVSLVFNGLVGVLFYFVHMRNPKN